MYAERSRWINLSTADFFFHFSENYSNSTTPNVIIDSKIWKIFHFLFLLRYNRAQFINNIFIDKIKHRKNMCICAYICLSHKSVLTVSFFSLSFSSFKRVFNLLIYFSISPSFFLSFSSSYHRRHILQRKGKRMRESERDIGNQ